MAPRTSLVIDPRFEGPPRSGHGGTVAALLAERLDPLPAAVEVVLRAPTPLGRALEVVADGAALRLQDGEQLLAEARPGALTLEPPPAPSVAEARAAGARSPWHDPARHPFPGCFGCGPSAPSDALHLRPGPLGDGRHATTWTPPVGVSAGLVRAALDCPSSGPAADHDAPGPYVLGTYTTAVHALPEPGVEHVLVA